MSEQGAGDKLGSYNFNEKVSGQAQFFGSQISGGNFSFGAQQAAARVYAEALPPATGEVLGRERELGEVVGKAQFFGSQFGGGNFGFGAERGGGGVCAEALPPATGEVLGRERELGEVMGLLEKQGCVAITGMGGQGKSTLAALVYREW